MGVAPPAVTPPPPPVAPPPPSAAAATACGCIPRCGSPDEFVQHLLREGASTHLHEPLDRQSLDGAEERALGHVGAHIDADDVMMAAGMLATELTRGARAAR